MSGVRAVSRLLRSRRLALSRAVSRPRRREQRPRGQGRGGRHRDSLREARGRERGGAARGRRALCGAGRAASPSRSRPAASPALRPRSGQGRRVRSRRWSGRRPGAQGHAAAGGPRRPGLGVQSRPPPCPLLPAAQWRRDVAAAAGGARARGPRPGSVLEPEAGSSAWRQRRWRVRAGTCGNVQALRFGLCVLGDSLRALWLESDGEARRVDRRPTLERGPRCCGWGVCATGPGQDHWQGCFPEPLVLDLSHVTLFTSSEPIFDGLLYTLNLEDLVI